MNTNDITNDITKVKNFLQELRELKDLTEKRVSSYQGKTWIRGTGEKSTSISSIAEKTSLLSTIINKETGEIKVDDPYIKNIRTIDIENALQALPILISNLKSPNKQDFDERECSARAFQDLNAVKIFLMEKEQKEQKAKPLQIEKKVTNPVSATLEKQKSPIRNKLKKTFHYKKESNTRHSIDDIRKTLSNQAAKALLTEWTPFRIAKPNTPDPFLVSKPDFVDTDLATTYDTLIIPVTSEFKVDIHRVIAFILNQVPLYARDKSLPELKQPFRSNSESDCSKSLQNIWAELAKDSNHSMEQMAWTLKYLGPLSQQGSLADNASSITQQWHTLQASDSTLDSVYLGTEGSYILEITIDSTTINIVKILLMEFKDKEAKEELTCKGQTSKSEPLKYGYIAIKSQIQLERKDIDHRLPFLNLTKEVDMNQLYKILNSLDRWLPNLEHACQDNESHKENIKKLKKELEKLNTLRVNLNTLDLTAEQLKNIITHCEQCYQILVSFNLNTQSEEKSTHQMVENRASPNLKEQEDILIKVFENLSPDSDEVKAFIQTKKQEKESIKKPHVLNQSIEKAQDLETILSHLKQALSNLKLQQEELKKLTTIVPSLQVKHIQSDFYNTRKEALESIGRDEYMRALPITHTNWFFSKWW